MMRSSVISNDYLRNDLNQGFLSDDSEVLAADWRNWVRMNFYGREMKSIF